MCLLFPKGDNARYLETDVEKKLSLQKRYQMCIRSNSIVGFIAIPQVCFQEYKRHSSSAILKMNRIIVCIQM